MRKIREVLRLHWQLGRSTRETAWSLGISKSVVSKVVQRAKDAGLDWASASSQSNEALEEALYGRPSNAHSRVEPDPANIHLQLKQPGMTLQLLHLEYQRLYPDGLKYTAYCDRYRRWRKQQKQWMRQHHVAGEKMFVDFSGKKPTLIHPDTGEIVQVELFVAVLGASSYTYAEAVASQRLEDFLGAHVRALEYFGGATQIVVPDQLRSAVSAPSRHEPVIQQAYADFGRHYNVSIIPARPRHPKDKAKVEVGVQVVQRWICARLRQERFGSLEALNGRIWELLEELNARPMRHLGASRKALFERYDRPALQSLPAARYEFGSWGKARVNGDYHITVEHHHYSVPHQLVHQTVETRLTATTLEVFHSNQCVAMHARNRVHYGYSTKAEHRPRNHQEWENKSFEPLLAWAQSVGAATVAMMERILSNNIHREQCWRSGKALQRLGQTYDATRIEVGCQRVLSCGGKSYKPVQRMLQRGLDLKPEEEVPSPPIEHENVRGPGYYH